MPPVLERHCVNAQSLCEDQHFILGGQYQTKTKFAALTHLLMCRIYASVNQVNIGSDNGLFRIRHQDIISNNVGLLLIGPLWTNSSEILI